MKHNISSAEAAILLPIIERMVLISRKSVVIATFIGIDRHEMKKAITLIKRIETVKKHNKDNEKWKMDKQTGNGKNSKRPKA